MKMETTCSGTTAPGLLGARHLQCLILWLTLAMAYANNICMAIVIVAIEDEQRNKNPLTSTTIGIILSSLLWGSTLLQIPLGYLASTWSAKMILTIATLISGISGMLTSMAFDEGGWMSLCGCRFVMGLCYASLPSCIHIILSKWVPPKERGVLATITYTGIDLGIIMAYPVSGLLIAAFGWRSVFYVFGSSSVIFAIILFILASDSPARSMENSFCTIGEAEKNYIEQSLGMLEKQQDDDNLKTPWRAILSSPPFWALFIVHCTDFWGFYVLLSEIPIYLAGALKFDIEENGFKSALPYVALFLLTLPSSCLSGWAERRGLARGLVRKIWNTVGHCGSALGIIGICLVPPDNTTLPVVLLIIAVGMNAGANSAYQINHIDLSPKHAGVLVGITSTAASVVAVLAPLIVGGCVTDTTNADQWHLIFYVTGATYFLGNLAFVLFGSGDTQWWNG